MIAVIKIIKLAMPKISNIWSIPEKRELNKRIFLSIVSPIMNGLYDSISLIFVERVSNGIIVLEKKRSAMPVEIAAIVTVCFVLKMYPISIPNNVKIIPIASNAIPVRMNDSEEIIPSKKK